MNMKITSITTFNLYMIFMFEPENCVVCNAHAAYSGLVSNLSLLGLDYVK